MQIDKKNILFLGYDNNETILIKFLRSKGYKVQIEKDKLFKKPKHDLIISFGYRHIIKQQILEDKNINIINLHISFLPWNRGAHPVFWSFYDNTPLGVTIHLIDKGIDTGPILFQKKISIDPVKYTFRDVYKNLVDEIENLFINNFQKIISKKYEINYQSNLGSFHRSKDLPEEFKGWDSNIYDEINRLKKVKSF